MPSVRPLNYYPASYERKFVEAIAEPVVLVFPNTKMADSFRNTLYNMRTALRQAAQEDKSLVARMRNIDDIVIFKHPKGALILHNPEWETFLQ